MGIMDKIKRTKTKLAVLVRIISNGFNCLPVADKKEITIVFGIAAGILCAMLVAKGITGKDYKKAIAIDSIKIPKDIYMKRENAISEDHLIPVGKFKGEINGEFEAFYLAVDVNGKTYVNYSIDFSAEAYHKSKGWEEITKEDIDRFQKQLHFLPARSRGIKY
jgi:hypothetical protein